eukprot:5902594-Pyramimonas_sp.AAC.1
MKKVAPAKKEERSANRERAPRGPIKRGPEGPCRAAGSTEQVAKKEVFSATPVDSATMQELFPGSGRAEVGRRSRGEASKGPPVCRPAGD